MRIVVAPDKFTGSLTAVQAAEAIGRGVRIALPDAGIVLRPVADGGDGTIDALIAADWTGAPVAVHGPTGRPGTALLARRGDTAVVELAGCCGRLLLPGGVPAPLTADTYGLGEAVLAAARTGVSDVVVAVGGSASTDGGLGLLRALGVRVLDADGRPITSPTDLVHADRLDTSGVPADLRPVRLTLASDVSAPLTGRSGAARLFGPQKGATPDQVGTLERAMSRWGEALAAHCGQRVGDEPGSGAAGGVVAGAVGGLHGVVELRITGGATFVLDAIGLADALADADAVIVGEGSLDAQSLLGKAPVAVAQVAARSGCAALAVVGRLDLDPRSLQRAGIQDVETLTGLAGPGQDPMRDAAVLAARAAEVLVRRHVSRP